MTRDEWLALPVAVALAYIYDHAPAALSDAIDSGKPVRAPSPPKYDNAIYRSGGIQWASETDAEGLAYWRKRKLESSNPEYAEKDARDAKSLGYWLEWRAAFPTALWSGERNRQRVTAAAPSGKPTVHPREPKPDATDTASTPPKFSDDDMIPYDRIPF